MRLSTLIRFAAAVAVLSILALTLMIARRSFFKEVSDEPPTNKIEALIPAKHASDDAISSLITKLEVENLPDVTPGERAFESARELLEKGDYIAAEEKLKYVNTYYPTAFSAPEARRILGEMNMDRLFAGKEFSEIITYEVKRGDSFYKIVKENQTNLDLLVYLNHLKRTDKLYPGDKFKLIRLNYRLVVDVPRGVLSIWNGSRYIKGYDILSSNLSKRTGTISTQLAAVEALDEGSRVTSMQSAFRAAEKIIVLKNPQVEIRANKEEGVVGIYLTNEDVEELALLLRAGNSVEIRY